MSSVPIFPLHHSSFLVRGQWKSVSKIIFELMFVRFAMISVRLAVKMCSQAWCCKVAGHWHWLNLRILGRNWAQRKDNLAHIQCCKQSEICVRPTVRVKFSERTHNTFLNTIQIGPNVSLKPEVHGGFNVREWLHWIRWGWFKWLCGYLGKFFLVSLGVTKVWGLFGCQRSKCFGKGPWSSQEVRSWIFQKNQRKGLLFQNMEVQNWTVSGPEKFEMIPEASATQPDEDFSPPFIGGRMDDFLGALGCRRGLT